MNIVLVVHKATGGIGSYVESLARQYVQDGQKVYVLAPKETTERYDFPQTFWPNTLRDVPALLAIIRKADAVHAHGYRAALLAHTWLRAARAQAGLFITWHNELPAGKKHALLARLPLRRTKVLGVVSSDLLDQARSFGVDSVFYEKVPSPHIAYLCQETEQLLASSSAHVRDARLQARAQLSKDLGVNLSDAPLIVTVARYAPQKDIPTLIESARGLSPDIQWLILGDGDADIADMLRQAQKTEVGARLILGGHYTNIPRALRSSDLFVLTSLWESGQPLVVQEAFAAGIPAVTTNGGGLADLCADGCGLACDVGDVQSLVRNIEYVLEGGDEIREKMICAALEKVQTIPSVAQLADKWLSFYRGGDL